MLQLLQLSRRSLSGRDRVNVKHNAKNTKKVSAGSWKSMAQRPIKTVAGLQSALAKP
jgi:hypothetical protein